MNWGGSVVAFDWICVAVLLASLLLGAWRGLVYEVMSVLGWVVSFILAQMFAGALAAHVPLDSASDEVRYAVAFVVLFVLGAFVGGFVASLVRRLANAIGLHPVDRTLGAVFGVLRGAVLLLVVAVVVNMTSLHEGAWWQDSFSAKLSTDVLGQLKPVLPETFRNYLPSPTY